MTELEKESVVCRGWWLEINPGADCYNSMAFYNFISSHSEMFKFWAFIKHDQDKEENGEPKPGHYHLIFNLVEPVDFSQVKVWFPGAHIEIASSTSACVQYLIHKWNADKTPYLPSDILTNNTGLLNQYLSIPRTEPFNPYSIWEYVKVDRMFTYTEFTLRFDVNKVKPFRLDIIEVIREVRAEEVARFRDTYQETRYNKRHPKK